ncbi:9141_t:CDS:2, partial [Diversispora eburnea]
KMKASFSNFQVPTIFQIKALEEAISIERSISLSLEAPDCFKIRELEKDWAELTKDGRLGIEPTSMYRGNWTQKTKTLTKKNSNAPRQRITLNRDALSNMEGLSITKKGIMVQAILGVVNAASDQIL